MTAALTSAPSARSPQQSASAIKALHLATYAEAVSRGRLDPDARVTLRDWERWYYPADGAAHAPALKRLRVRAQGNGTRTSAHDLVRLYDRVAAGSIADADVMRRHLQWQPASGDVATGFKAGSLPGVLTVGMEQRVVGNEASRHRCAAHRWS